VSTSKTKKRPETPQGTGWPADAAERAFLLIASSPRSTDTLVQVLRHAADATGCGLLDLAADRLQGTARRPGPAPADLSGALAQIEALEERFGRSAVAVVARSLRPGDQKAQRALIRKIQRHRKLFTTG
jgi:hypothetical protein